jgi:hypothetical protein
MANRQIIVVYFFLCFLSFCAGCARNAVGEYIVAHQEQPSEILVAMSNGRVIVGMNVEQIKLLLGEPMLKEQRTPQVERWIYRNLESGITQGDAYTTDSAFPQGIGFVIPLYYRAQEIFIDFAAGKVCRVEHILNY